MRDYLLGAYSPEQMSTMSPENVYWSLQRNKFSIIFGIMLQICFGILWLIAAIVPGFALYNGLAGEVSAYTHLAWWFIVDYLCVCFGLFSLNFALGYTTTQGRIEKNVQGTIAWLQTYRFILALAGISHIVHVILSGLELHNNSSTLATSYLWVLIVLIVLLSVSVLLIVYLIVRTQTYLTNLSTAFPMGKIDNYLTLPPLPSQDVEQGGEGGGGENVAQEEMRQPPSAAGARITTPLLAQLQTSKRIVHKLK